ncbi:DUF4244 domain-containing protein [Dactylosporangium sp. NPDC051541]|uniref:DUF4244 domain-containing protein n=1 Tax=Dactylosporangium sp. NPDC051541 TaxID=3363977 RepID=UPI0037A27AD8
MFITRQRMRRDDGALSMEYCGVVVAAMVFVGILLAIVRSDGMRDYMNHLLTGLVP